MANQWESIFKEIDPVIQGQEHLSLYQYAWNNPINKSDPDGQCPWCIAALKGAAQEYGTQVLMNLASGKGLKESLTHVDLKEIATAAVTDGLTLGLGSLLKVGKVAKIVDKIADRAKPLLDKVDDIGEKVAAKLSKGCGCFTENTPVLVAKGHKAIKNVKVGDKVWAYNAKTKKYALKTVTKVFTVATDSLFRVYVAGQSIETTPEHPFLVKNRWVNARNLKTGNYLTLYRGKQAKIDSITLDQQRTLTYNFTVANYHTYTVSKAGVVVHNSKGCDLAKGGVYALEDKGKVVRTGRTKDLARREAEHANDPVLGKSKFETKHKTDDYAEQRGLEDKLYKQHESTALPDNGGYNKTPALSERNKNKEKYRQAADNYLKNQ